jgi:hypothetical protein
VASSAAGPTTSATGQSLRITYSPVGTPFTADELAAAVSILQERADAMGDDAEVAATSDGRISITVANMPPGAETAFNLRVGIDGFIYLRPVISCDFAAGAPSLPAIERSDPSVAQTLPYSVDNLLVPCEVGPAGGTGEVFSDDAEAFLVSDDQWGVSVSLKPGPAGEDVWNTIAAACFNADATCPSRQLAIEVNGFIVSAPSMQSAEFSGTVQITGNFNEVSAQHLADQLNRGALPFVLQVDAVQQIAT